MGIVRRWLRYQARIALAVMVATAGTIVLAGCGSLGEERAPQETGPVANPDPQDSVSTEPYLKLIQSGKIRDVRDGDRISVERQPFGFIFPLLHYNAEKGIFNSVQVAGSGNRQFLSLRGGRRVEEPQNGLILFAPGMGMSGSADGRYSVFFLESNEAHHYIVFEPGNPEARRAEPIRSISPHESEVRFDISRFKHEEKVFSVDRLPLKEIYFVVLMDRNRNGIMENEELFRFTLAFL